MDLMESSFGFAKSRSGAFAVPLRSYNTQEQNLNSNLHLIMQAFVVCGNLFDLPTLTGPLKDAGFTVIAAPTGKQAIKKLAALTESPDLILVDLETPGLDLGEMSGNWDSDEACQRIAYGPHVQRDSLEAAAAAGFKVLTRGQLFGDLPNWISQWNAT
jgi:CheY-like chemotaxis protein